MEMEKLKKFFLDIDNGLLIINGEEIKNVTAFSLVFKEGEYGLEITQHNMYTSEPKKSGLFIVSTLSNEISDQSTPD